MCEKSWNEIPDVDHCSEYRGHIPVLCVAVYQHEAICVFCRQSYVRLSVEGSAEEGEKATSQKYIF